MARKRISFQLEAENVDALQAATALLPQEGQRTAARVLNALIRDAEERGTWKKILRAEKEQ